jgi:hypothetical protein
MCKIVLISWTRFWISSILDMVKLKRVIEQWYALNFAEFCFKLLGLNYLKQKKIKLKPLRYSWPPDEVPFLKASKGV